MRLRFTCPLPCPVAMVYLIRTGSRLFRHRIFFLVAIFPSSGRHTFSSCVQPSPFYSITCFSFWLHLLICYFVSCCGTSLSMSPLSSPFRSHALAPPAFRHNPFTVRNAVKVSLVSWPESQPPCSLAEEEFTGSNISYRHKPVQIS